MPKGQEYIAIDSSSLFATRTVRTYPEGNSLTQRNLNKANIIHVVVPFSGFDGQALSGSGALVWEGEVLDQA